MTSMPDVPRLDQCEEIARLLHATATAAHRQHPRLLNTAGLTWLQSGDGEAQPAQIAALLAKCADSSSLLQAVDHLLGQIFVPAFQSTKVHGQVRQRVQHILTPVPLVKTDALPTASPGSTPNHDRLDPDFPPSPPPQPSLEKQAIGSESAPASAPASTSASTVDPNAPLSGLLVVDAENMHPSATLEAYLQSLCQYPIRYRLAFGNWRTLGHRDQEFYRRGYQMIHVPSGKNSADIKMSLDASLISLHHPSIREVFVCSADSDLLHLGYTLLRQGMTPYQVSHNQRGFTVLNLATQSTHTFSPPPESSGTGASAETTAPTPHVPSSLVQMKQWLRILILQEQTAHPGQPVTVGRLGTLFRDRNHIAPNQVLQAYENVATLKQLLEADDDFVLTPATDGVDLQVALKISATTALSPSPSLPFAAPITDGQTLEQAILAVLAGLLTQPGETVSLSVLGSTFAQVYQQPMSQVLKAIGEPKRLPTFLAKCKTLRLQRQGQNWQVGLASG